jgi:hypothetical protein
MIFFAQPATTCAKKNMLQAFRKVRARPISLGFP